MKKEVVIQLHSQFEGIVHIVSDSEVEFWYARELQEALGYDRWENFKKVIEKAITSCETLGVTVLDHFRDVTKMVKIGFGAERPIEDIMLTRYACYLIAQNGDPRKEQIAFAQTYFAVQTRKQELIEERIRLRERMQARQKLRESETQLSKNIYERGVDDQGFGRIRSKGDAALFGGNTTQAMKSRLGVPDKRPLADFLPTVTIAAKNLATEITNYYNVEQHDMYGEPAITGEHIQSERIKIFPNPALLDEYFLLRVKLQEEDINYLLNCANHFLKEPINRENICGTFLGIRPLVIDKHDETDATSMSRDYKIDVIR